MDKRPTRFRTLAISVLAITVVALSIIVIQKMIFDDDFIEFLINQEQSKEFALVTSLGISMITVIIATAYIFIKDSSGQFSVLFSTEKNENMFAKVSELDSRVRILQKLLNEKNVRSESATFDDNQEKRLVNIIEGRIRTEGIKNIVDQVVKKSEQRVSDFKIYEMAKIYESTIHRIYSEIGRLSGRGTISLIIGIASAIGGFSFLTILVFQGPIENPADRSILNYLIVELLPRLALVLMIEVFGYFFLRHYALLLSEIKYFHNEITNIEMKIIALYYSSTNNMIDEILREFSRTERNFIQKGQEISNDKGEIDISKKLEEKILKIITESVNSLKVIKE